MSNHDGPSGWTPGWIDNPQGVQAILATLPFPYFAQAAPHLMTGPEADVMLYKAWHDALKAYPSYVPQTVGDCTSQGGGHAVDLLQCVQIAIGHASETYKETCTEALYGEGREIAGMLNSWSDGCWGGAIAKAVSTVGVTPREAVGPYDGKRAQKWGHDGTPADIKAKAKDHLVKTVSLVSTWDELRAALSNGYPVTVASNQGFQLQRNEKGIAEAHGSWPHQMMICGILYAGTPDECAVIANSWGDDACKGPTPMDMPKFCFGARRRVVEGMLSGKDSWAFSSFVGYPGQPLPSAWKYNRAA